MPPALSIRAESSANNSAALTCDRLKHGADHAPCICFLASLGARMSTQLACCGRQTTASAEAKQADVRAEHLRKQLKEQRSALGSKVKESDLMNRRLQAAQAAVDDCQAKYVPLSHVHAPAHCVWGMHSCLTSHEHAHLPEPACTHVKHACEAAHSCAWSAGPCACLHRIMCVCSSEVIASPPS